MLLAGTILHLPQMLFVCICLLGEVRYHIVPDEARYRMVSGCGAGS